MSKRRSTTNEGRRDCPAFVDAVRQAWLRSFYGVEIIINETYRLLREQAERSFNGAMAQFANVSDRV